MTAQVGDQTISASQGDCLHLPRGIVHSFRNTGNENLRMLVTATPAGIEKFFDEAFYPAVEGKEPPPVTPELIGRLIAPPPGMDRQSSDRRTGRPWNSWR